MPRTAKQVIDQEFLIARAKILELAAFFDRLDAADGSESDQSRFDLLQQGCKILTDGDGEKAKRVQLLFSRPYSTDWKQEFGV